MKRASLLILFILLTAGIIAKPKTIINPAYDVQTSGIFNISKIELSSKETRLYVHCTFVPKWWISFTKENFIRESGSGKKIFATRILRGEFDKEIYMPASGDSTFILIFPALNKSVKKIDYGEGESVYLYGLKLDSKQKITETPEVPVTVNTWITAELSKAKKKVPSNYTSSDFFSRDTARLIGYIKGYDRRLGFSTGIIYASNEITREDFPLVINVHEDGRFEVNLPMIHPQYTYAVFAERLINFYIEPGQTLSMTLDWKEFLEADRRRNIRYLFQDIKFEGPLAQINNELKSVQIKRYNYKNQEKDIKTLTPAEFKATQMSAWESEENQLNEKLRSKDFAPQTKVILKNELAASMASVMYDFVMNREYYAGKDTANKIMKTPVDTAYYDFLNKLNLNDPSLLISSDFSTLINRFEYSTPFTTYSGYSRVTKSAPFFYYLFTDLKLKPSQEDVNYINLKNSFNEKLQKASSNDERKALLKLDSATSAAFEKKYSKFKKAYLDKYPVQSENLSVREFINEWANKDSALVSFYKLQKNLVYDIAKVRSFAVFSRNYKINRDQAIPIQDYLKEDIKNEFLDEEVIDFFERKYPKIAKTAYDLPAGRATEVFRKIIDQHKGKMLFVDFWGIFCGPCIASIERNKPIREKYKGSEVLDFIFITSDGESPKTKYEEFVKKQELQNTYRLTQDEYYYLRELFKFNGIPRYIVIGKDGRVIDDDFAMYNFAYELQRLLAQH